MYTNKDIAEKFGISRESARQWAAAFEEYLSPSATPEKGRQRNYVEDDLGVFALIASMKAGGARMDEIAAALASGQRGVVSDESAIVPRSDASLTNLRRDLAQVRLELDAAKTELLLTQGENRLMKQQLKELRDENEARIERLLLRIARHEAGQGGA